MTHITDLSVMRVRLRFREPVRYGRSTVSAQETGILRLATDDGVVGLGEVAGPTLPADLEATVGRAARALVGMNLRDVDGVDDVTLRGAIDAAALDVLGQQGGHTIADLLGGGAVSVALNGLLVVGRATPDEAAACALALVDSGFRTIKLKRERELGDVAVREAMRAVRDAVGLGIALRLDLNGDRSEHAVISWLTTLAPLGLEYVEQPISPSLGAAAMARVRRSIPMPLAADESVTDPDAATALLDARACDVLVVKPSRVGGPRAAARIAHAAAEAGALVTISTMYESGVGLAAALHVAATVPGDRAHGLATAALLESDLIDGSLSIVGGRMYLPPRPGLGVTLSPAALAASWVIP